MSETARGSEVVQRRQQKAEQRAATSTRCYGARDEPRVEKARAILVCGAARREGRRRPKEEGGVHLRRVGARVEPSSSSSEEEGTTVANGNLMRCLRASRAARAGRAGCTKAQGA